MAPRKTGEVDYDVATIVNMIDLCRDMHVLPIAGGLFDQDALFIDLYEYVFQLRATREDMDRRQQEANARVKGGQR